MKLAGLLLCLALVAAPSAAAIDPATLSSLGFHQHPGARLPLDARLIDASGNTVTLDSAIANRPTILILEYLRCSNLCSLVLSGAVHAIRASHLTPGRDVNLVAVSIDPRDAPADAAAAQAMYVGRFPEPATAAQGIHFFTAKPEGVRRIASAVGFPYRYDRSSNQFAHPAGFVVITPDGRISRYILGLSPKPASLRQAVAEAALEKVEPPAHPLLCLCFGYDPDEGSVAALTMRLVRFASSAVVLACAALILFLSLRRRPA
jgi:protein SCO1/2